MKKPGICSLILSLILLISCDGSDNPLAYDDTTNSRGKATIYVEKNLQPYLETTIMSFEGFRPEAHITAKYEREIDVINTFIDRKTDAIIISRDFTKKEREEFLADQVAFRTNKILVGSIALLTPKTEDSTYTETEFLRLLTSTNEKDPKILFDDVQSANFEYFLDRIAPKQFGPNVKCLKGNQEVIDYIKNNKHCIGVIGFNWISDIDDPKVLERCKNLNIVSVSKGSTDHFVPPFTYYVYEKEYPFIHFWYIHNKGSKSDLEAGFVNYLISEKGQLIAKKSGLQSYYKMTREFNFVVE